MALNTEENHKESEEKIQKERRSFLKKTAYAAPVLVVLGQLARPARAEADSTVPPPPSW